MENNTKIFIAKWVVIGLLILAIFCQAGSTNNENAVMFFKLFNMAAAATLLGTFVYKRYPKEDKRTKLGETIVPFFRYIGAFIGLLVTFSFITETMGERIRNMGDGGKELFLTFWGTGKDAILGIKAMGTGVIENGVEETIVADSTTVTLIILTITLVWLMYKTLGLGLKNSINLEGIFRGLKNALSWIIGISVAAGLVVLAIALTMPEFYGSWIKSPIVENTQVAALIASLVSLVIFAIAFFKGKGPATANS